MINNTKITVEVTVEAKLNTVWDFWTLPRHVENWNFASDDWYCPKAINNLQIGERFCYVMSSKDGILSFDFEGIYDEVIDFKKISYSLLDGRQVFIEFENLGEKVKITETFDAENVNDFELQKSGWQAILNNFKKYVETNC